MRRFAGLLVLMLATASISLAPVAAVAADSPVYTVANTDEDPTLPDGVWFRNSPDAADTSRITGLGVYKGEQVRPGCVEWGKADGPYGNRVWYYVYNLTRPVAAGRSNEGWLNAHYVDDGMPANQLAAGVPLCAPLPAAAQPEAPGGASIYYSPFDGDWITSASPRHPYAHYVRSVTSATLYSGEWRDGCNTSRLGDFPDMVGGRQVTTLTGWSAGRDGVIGFLRDYPDRAQHIRYVILYDPGTYAELSGGCYADEAGQVLENWLASNSSNHLLIIAGRTTRDAANPSVVNGTTYYHRGLQEVYFPRIRTDAAAAARTAVCNYNDMSHEDTWWKFQDWANQLPVTTTCPAVSDAATADTLWHP